MHPLTALDGPISRTATALALVAIVLLAAVAFSAGNAPRALAAGGGEVVLPVEPDGGIGTSGDQPIPVEPDGGIGWGADLPLPVEPDGGIGGEVPAEPDSGTGFGSDLPLPVEPDGGIGN